VTIYNYLSRTFSIVALIILLGCLLIAKDTISAVPIVQPGAPGNATRDLDAETAVAIANSSYTIADAHFMQDMIIHHHQALVMSRLAAQSTNNEAILDLAGRIDISQADEITFMQDWLREREEKVPNPIAQHQKHTNHNMVGTASSTQMTQLAESKSTDFDQLFLTLMITHHNGAIKMVEELRKQSGSTYDPLLNEFVSDVTNDQAVEIDRMNALLVGLSSDPRAGLTPGLYDAGEAIMNMELLVSHRKPLGFYDPANPAERGVDKPDTKQDDDAKLAETVSIDEAENKAQSIEKAAEGRRYPMLSFSNTDMAFRDDLLVTGSYHGFNMYRIDKDGIPTLITSVICPGGQGDISIVGDLLIMSVEQTRGRQGI
jgi:uncharacterized protein (DUF305 family)